MITLFHKGDASLDVEPLTFTLIGVVDFMDGYSTNPTLVTKFFNEGHPRSKGSGLLPNIIKSANESQEHAPFGIFLAYKSNNPQSNRVLLNEKDGESLRQEYPFIKLDSKWDSWDCVLKQYS
jgi:hypothetical protein